MALDQRHRIVNRDDRQDSAWPGTSRWRFAPRQTEICGIQSVVTVSCFGGNFISQVRRWNLAVAQTCVVAIARYRAVVARLRWPSS